ncbi:unnamed protein product [Boreogadus saida]
MDAAHPRDRSVRARWKRGRGRGAEGQKHTTRPWNGMQPQRTCVAWTLPDGAGLGLPEYALRSDACADDFTGGGSERGSDVQSDTARTRWHRCGNTLDTARCGPEAGRSGAARAVDTCASAPCRHGNCSVAAAGPGYACACHVGFAGPDCGEEADVCEGHLCGHGATCLHGPGRYACLCAENYTGVLCK